MGYELVVLRRKVSRRTPVCAFVCCVWCLLSLRNLCSYNAREPCMLLHIQLVLFEVRNTVSHQLCEIGDV